jgi:cytochrome P450
MTELDVTMFDPLEDGVPGDPYPVYDRLREEDPVHRMPGGRWLLTRHEDCTAVLRNPAMSSERDLGDTGEDGEPSLLQAYLAKLMLFMDAPDHTRLRGLVTRAFTPRVVEGLRPRITELVDQLLDDAAEAGELDVIAGFGRPLPVAVIAEMLGVPGEDQDRFRSWSEALAHTVDPAMTPDTAARAAVAGLEFMEYFHELSEERRQRPREDLLSALVAEEDAGDRLSTDELVANCILLLIAGHETTTNLIGNGTLALLRNPDELARFRAAPDLAKSAVEEILRYDSPVHLTGRGVREDVEIGGVTVPAGDRVTILLAAANRDPAAFERPDRLDLSRTDNRHLAFSSGPHFCLGAALARLEGQIALSSLVTRFPDLALADEQLEWNPTTTLRGLQRLPVTL